MVVERSQWRNSSIPISSISSQWKILSISTNYTKQQYLKFGMLDSDRSRLSGHMALEKSSLSIYFKPLTSQNSHYIFITSSGSSDTNQWHSSIFGGDLWTNRSIQKRLDPQNSIHYFLRSGIISLVLLDGNSMRSVLTILRESVSRMIRHCAGISLAHFNVTSRSNLIGSRSHENQGRSSFYFSTNSEGVFRRIWDFRSESWIVIRTRSSLMLLGTIRELLRIFSKTVNRKIVLLTQDRFLQYQDAIFLYYQLQ